MARFVGNLQKSYQRPYGSSFKNITRDLRDDLMTFGEGKQRSVCKAIHIPFSLLASLMYLVSAINLTNNPCLSLILPFYVSYIDIYGIADVTGD